MELFLRDEDGGGSGILIKKPISYKPIQIPTKFEVEAVGINLKIQNDSVAVFAWYNKPSNNSINLEFLDWIGNNQKNYLIAGDLNAKCDIWCKNPNNAGDMLLKWIDENEAMILNDTGLPTSFWQSTGSPVNNILDLYVGSNIFIEKLHSYKTLTRSEVDIYQNKNYHVPVEAIFAITKVIKNINPSKNDVLDINKADWCEYQQILEALYPTIDHKDNIELVIEKITKAYEVATKSAIPLVKKTDRITNLPKEIMEDIRLKNYWKNRYKRTKRKNSKANYDSMKEVVRLSLDRHDSNKMKKYVESLGHAPLSSKPLWRRVNRLRNVKRSKEIPTLTKDGVDYETDTEKAKIFADRMYNTFNESTESGNKFDNRFRNKINDYITNEKFLASYPDRHVVKFKMKHLKYVIKKMNNKTSIDAFGISNLLLKKTPPAFRGLLLTMFNRCLEENFIPTVWKESIIKMIEKKADDRTDPKNYRPISITSCLMRLLERLILLRLEQHLKENKILIDSQSGFRRRRSTRDNLVFLVQKSQETKNRGRSLLAIFFDIEAAFDKVWHNGLIYKLIQIKTPYYLLKIIINFLSERSFKVKVGDQESERKTITCGVPQGACLSPTLFAIYINDSPCRSSKNSEQTMLFADDTVYILMYKNKTSRVQKKVYQFLKELELWAFRWRVTLAPHKCNYMVISKNSKLDSFELKLNGTIIPLENNIRFLGLRIDPRMTFEHQVNHIKATCRERFNILKIISHKSWHLTKKTLVEIYHSLIRSIMEYTSFIYDLLPPSLKNLINTIQNDALRIIYQKDRTFSNEKLYELSKEKTLEIRLDELKQNYLYKAMMQRNPLIKKSYSEYKSFKGGRTLSIATIFCNAKCVNDSVLDSTFSEDDNR
jgi:hypothetical protein